MRFRRLSVDSPFARCLGVPRAFAPGTSPSTRRNDEPESAVSSVADVSLSDLNLSTPEGMRLARDRLHTMAERLCADRGGGRAVGH